MNLMSSGLQKAAGDKLRGLLSAMTSNPFKGVLTGLGITSVIQSSSATTVMVVSFVNAGLLTLALAEESARPSHGSPQAIAAAQGTA